MQSDGTDNSPTRENATAEQLDRCRRRIAGGIASIAVALAVLLVPGADLAFAHGIGGRDAAFVAATKGPDLLPFMYLGAKHMVTGYDHLLFIFGVIFFLYRLRDVLIYVTLFSIGHSITLLAGVLLKIDVNAYLVDAIIGLSVAYKAFDNLGGFKSVFGVQPNNKIAVAGFGLIHGLGFAAALQDLRLPQHMLVYSLVGFNIGVEIGQLAAVAVASLLARTILQFRPAPPATGMPAVVVSAILLAVGTAWFLTRAVTLSPM